MISVIIPTYKRRSEFLAKLRHNIPFLRGCEIIVVNDAPTDSLRESMRGFGDVRLIENRTNMGFAGAVHRGIMAAKHQHVVLLNNDVTLASDSFKKAKQQLEQDPRLFAVAFSQTEKDGKKVGKNRIFWSNGFFQHHKAESMDSGETAWAEGGACMIDREKYKLIGGFDTLFSPFYWEDIDLSYRARKAGYHIVFDDSITVEHHHESTIGSEFKSSEVKAIAYRNQFFFIWKNITDNKLINSHILHLFPALAVSLLKMDWAFVSGFLQALPRINEIILKRAQVSRQEKVPDVTILNEFHA